MSQSPYWIEETDAGGQTVKQRLPRSYQSIDVAVGHADAWYGDGSTINGVRVVDANGDSVHSQNLSGIYLGVSASVRRTF